MLANNNNNINKAVIAANRFGLGAKSNELKQASKNPELWVKNQLTPIQYQGVTVNSHDVFIAANAYRLERKAAKEKEEQTGIKEKFNSDNHPQKLLRQFVIDSAKSATTANNSVSWRLLDFFSNHFSVTAQGNLMQGLAPTLEREAIAPYLLGPFENMLMAVTKHPAMLIYLNNERSYGVNTRLGKRGKGLNENLARELLELHTLGVNGGYSQHDVIELAKGITGWSVDNGFKSGNAGFVFRENGHEPGARTLLSTQYNQKGIKQGEAMLLSLARHPNTAKHICFKLARHFISDTPEKSLVDKMVDRWLATEGNLKEVMLALIEAPESWQNAPQKFKTPREFVLSTLRAVGSEKIKDKFMLSSFQLLGQRPFYAGSPAGYPDEKEDWDGGSAIMARIGWANVIAAMSRANAEEVMENVLQNTVSETTYKTVIRAESRKQALTLLLMSPEFQRR